MLNIELSYEANGMRNYLTVKFGEQLNKYQLKMLENNQIPGLLPVHSRQMNGMYYAEYDISGMRKLKKVLGTHEIRGKEARMFFVNFLRDLQALEEYFLSYTQCLLDAEYIFLDETNNARMVYLPTIGEQPSTEQTVRELCLNLLVEYFTSDNDMFFMDLLRYVNMQDFSLNGLIRRIESAMEDKKKEPVYQKNEADIKQEKQEDITGHEPTKEDIRATRGFLVPGGQDEHQELDKTDKEKKTGFLKKLLSNGKKAEEVINVHIPGSGNDEKKVQVVKQEQPVKPQKSPEINSVWKGTQIIDAGTNAGHTVILGEDRMPYLLHQNQRIELNHFPFTVGRQDTDYVIPSSFVSRPHISITLHDDSYYVTDENSRNHTYINGKQIPPFTEMKLQNRDTIRLANEDITFCTGE